MPALKSASGLLSSAAENCRTRSSRDFVSDSVTSSRTRCCTALELLVREDLVQLPREVPVLRPEHLVDLAAEVLRDRAGLVGELLVELTRRALELGLDVLRVGARLLAIEHTRADLDRVPDDLDRVLAVALALADEPHRGLVVHDQALDDNAVADDAHLGVPERSCCFHRRPTVGPPLDGMAAIARQTADFRGARMP